MATAKQIAARKLFAERARAGTLKTKRGKNPVAKTAKNPIAKKALTAKQYVTRPSQTTKKAPSARLTTRRAKALKAPAGYFPNPMIYFLFSVAAKTQAMSDFHTIAHFESKDDAVLFAKTYAAKHSHLSVKVSEK